MRRMTTGQSPIGGKCQYIIPPPDVPGYEDDPGIIMASTIDEEGLCGGWPPLPSQRSLRKAKRASMAPTFLAVGIGVVALAIWAHRS